MSTDAPSNPPLSGGGFVEVLDSENLKLEEQEVITVNGRRVLICRSDAGLRAMLDVCPHAAQPLSGGDISGITIECPHHGACFDLRDGKPTNGVTTQAIKFLEVRESAGRISIVAPPAFSGYMGFKKQ